MIDWCTLVERFALGRFVAAGPLTGGHIHRSFRVDCARASGQTASYVFQQINLRVFARPDLVAENATRVARHLARATANAPDATRAEPTSTSGESAKVGGTRPTHATDRAAQPVHATALRPLRFIETPAGESLVYSLDGACWRAMEFVPGTHAIESAGSLAQVRAVAAAFGAFQSALADWSGLPLHETIPGFHDTPARLRTLAEAVAADMAGRASSVRAEIDAVLNRRALAARLTEAHRGEGLPLRVVHSDAKPSNVLFDAAGRVVCVIDLDTVMPGLSLHDFGDLVRSMGSAAAEDEPDAARVAIDPQRFAAIAEGYLSQTAAMLTGVEKSLVYDSALVIVLEQAARFLTDHLQGDRYYAIHRPHHNLDRCRVQLALLASLERQEGGLRAVVAKELRGNAE